MEKFQIHTIESAPQESKKLLENSKTHFGMLPNLHGVLAESPNTLNAYKMLHDMFQNSSFDNNELTVVWQTINVENECHYCVPAHTLIAHMMKVPQDLIEALRNRTPISNEKLEVLRETTLSLIKNRGRISDSEIRTFYSVGYQKQQLLEIILGLAQKTISNYTNHIANTPVDAAFEKFSWSK